jgi:hypothetical protein
MGAAFSSSHAEGTRRVRISIRNLGLGIGAVLTLLVAYLSVTATNDRLNEKSLGQEGP